MLTLFAMYLYSCHVHFLTTGNDSEWVDIVEPEIRQILEIERAGKDGQVKVKNTNGQTKQGPSGQNGQGAGGHGSYNHGGGGRSSQQEEPSTPTSPSKKSPILSPKMTKNFDLNYGYVESLTLEPRVYSRTCFNNCCTTGMNRKKQLEPTPGTSSQAIAAAMAKNKSPRLPTKVHRSNSNSGSNQRLNAWSSRQRLSNEKGKSSSRKDLSLHKKLSRHAMSKSHMNSIAA